MPSDASPGGGRTSPADELVQLLEKLNETRPRLRLDFDLTIAVAGGVGPEGPWRYPPPEIERAMRDENEIERKRRDDEDAERQLVHDGLRRAVVDRSAALALSSVVRGVDWQAVFRFTGTWDFGEDYKNAWTQARFLAAVWGDGDPQTPSPQSEPMNSGPPRRIEGLSGSAQLAIADAEELVKSLDQFVTGKRRNDLLRKQEPQDCEALSENEKGFIHLPSKIKRLAGRLAPAADLVGVGLVPLHEGAYAEDVATILAAKQAAEKLVAQLHRQFLGHDQPGTNPPPGTHPGTPQDQTTHSSDFTFVRWFGREYMFALGVQSSAVKALWKEWEKSGLGLHQDTICNAIDAERDSFRIDKAFRDHPALGSMIQKMGDGRFRLAEPDAASTEPAAKGKQSTRIPPAARRKPR